MYKLNWKFRLRLISCYNYIMVTCSYDINAILVWPLWNRIGSELIKAVINIHECLRTREYNPNHEILNNKENMQIKEYLCSEWVHFQLILLFLYGHNAAKRVIKIFKEFYIAIFYLVYLAFPLHL